jgi:hypothetical protein
MDEEWSREDYIKHAENIMDSPEDSETKIIAFLSMMLSCLLEIKEVLKENKNGLS